jgi:hypothetical protein
VAGQKTQNAFAGGRQWHDYLIIEIFAAQAVPHLFQHSDNREWNLANSDNLAEGIIIAEKSCGDGMREKHDFCRVPDYTRGMRFMETAVAQSERFT